MTAMPRKSRALRLASFLASTAAALSLSACISFGPEPPESLLTLTSEAVAPVGDGAAITSDNAIAIYEPFAPARLDVTRVPVQIDDSSIAYVPEAIWVEKPARLFRRVLAETIRAEGVRAVMDEDDTGLAATTILRGSLVDFGYDVPTGSVVVRYDAILTNGENTPRRRRFESIVPGVAPEANPVGVALNRAANDVARQVADWAR